MAAREDRLLTIDTHHHMLPDFFWQETENAHAPVGGLAPLRWSPDVTVSFMDNAGIDVAVVSLSTPGVHTGDSAKARTLARRCNEFAATLVQAKPDRFASFACLPLPAVDASLEELAYAMDVLKLDGCVLSTSILIPTTPVRTSRGFGGVWIANGEVSGSDRRPGAQLIQKGRGRGDTGCDRP